MKKNIIFGVIITVLGLLAALGPQYLFKVCNPSAMSHNASSDDCCDNTHDNDKSGAEITASNSSCGCGGNSNAAMSYPKCHWTAQAEIGLGFLIAALGLCMIVFNSMQTQLGLLIGVFFSSIIVLFIPHGLIGGCDMMSMTCRRAAFPAITIIGSILFIISALLFINSIKCYTPPHENKHQ